ncbi:hypothetical protein SEUCBS140593_002798 [Sporothrix eucalyptigena]|uniref:Aldehyde dehydrogenase domain-containing protein n=1 Tax=Sporothrix eucalyptigena TaxID=1812306 RepID=A0ABP0B9F1_9PEZI
MSASTLPLIIDGRHVDTLSAPGAPVFIPNEGQEGVNNRILVLGATPDLCRQAADSSAAAFATWRHTSPRERQALFLRAAQLLQEHSDKARQTIQDEIRCSPTWAAINVNDGIAILESVAALITSGVLSGTSPIVGNPEAHAVVLKEPLGVVLGIAPWNAPLILGIRAVAAAVAAGNTAILKGSELSPRTHYFVANLFHDAGFPSGVVNFLVHRMEDASDCFEALIAHPAVRKCNFTGSTGVGRHVAMRAAFFLKPVLLELGGKNFAVVLADADLDQAATRVLEGALLNSGQICMSTDLILVAQEVEKEFRAKLHACLDAFAGEVTSLINPKSGERVQKLLDDVKRQGATLTRSKANGDSPSAVVIENISPDKQFWSTECFGPAVGIRVIDDISQVPALVNASEYGLSAAIFTKNHVAAIHMAKKLDVGAVHINGSTVHDEACLPHGGVKSSGWGRFGGHWGFDEFLQTKTVIVNP